MLIFSSGHDSPAIARTLAQLRLQYKLWRSTAIDLLAPPECAGCGRIGSGWCAECAGRTVLFTGNLCSVCGSSQTSASCAHCAAYPSYFDKARSYAAYQDPLRRILLRFKYQRDQLLGELVANLVVEMVHSATADMNLVIPVPLGEGRLRERGYNQVDLFARPLAERLGLRYLPEALRRDRETRSQVGLTGDQRMMNLANAFRASDRSVAGRRVLLLDDVFTTGSTGNACAQALKDAGAARVFLFTLARAVGKEQVITEIA